MKVITMCESIIWNLVPPVSFGPLKLGMCEKDYIEILGNDCIPFKTLYDYYDTLIFEKQNMRLTIDEKQIVKGISVFRKTQAFLGDVQLLGRELCDVDKELKQAGYIFEKIDVGLWYEEFKIVLVESQEVIDCVELGGFY
jgi:hypothetical protein